MMVPVMGLTKVPLKIKHPSNPEKFIEANFLVDSGAAYTVLPRKYWDQLGIKASFDQTFVLADGRTVKRSIGNALIEYQGREVGSPIVLGQANDSLLLGVLTLEALGLVLDPFSRKLYPAKLMM